MTVLRVQSGNSSLEVDSYGAYIRSLVLSGNDVLKKSTDGIATHGGCASLIPYANRVRNASYRWKGKYYSLPKNNGSHSIHGFTRDMKWEVLSENDYLTLSTLIDREDYPSRLECRSSFRLRNGSLEIFFTFVNVGGIELPLSVGLHPYFLHDGYWKIEDPDKIEMLNYEDSYFPDGTTTSIDSELLASTNEREFDNCFLIGPNLTLSTKNHRIKIHNENMDYFVIYNGKYSDGKSVAIEPMTSAPDAFNNGIGLVELNPKCEFSCSTSFTLL